MEHKPLAWYKELDADLKSARTGSQYQSIACCAPRLLQLSIEPLCEAAASVCKIDKGQNDACASALVLRLAEQFQTQTNAVRTAVLKVLLYVSEEHKKQSHGSSLLSRIRLPDAAEVLKKVKAVLKSGDVTARSLTLRALGCLSELEAECSGLCCLFLEAMDSDHVREVQAAFFAAGRLCEISVPSALLCLRKVRELVADLKTTPEVKTGAVRLLAAMALRPFEAHEEGTKLMLEHPSTALVEATLSALSELALKSKLILPNQARLLLDYVRSDPRESVQMVALVFLEKVLPRVSYMEFGPETFRPVLSLIENPDGIPAMRLQALRVFAKGATLEDAFSILELAALDANSSVAFESLRVLVQLASAAEKFRETSQETASDMEVETLNPNPVNQLERLVLLVCDRLTLLDDEFEAQRRFPQMIGTLADGCPQAAPLLVDCLLEMLETIVAMGNTEAAADDGTDVVMHDAGNYSVKNVSKGALICLCLGTCFRNLGLGFCTKKTAVRLEHVIEFILGSDAFRGSCSCIAMLSAAILHRNDVAGEAEKKLLRYSENLSSWEMYKLGKHYCLFGLWNAAEQVFTSITSRVSSEKCYFWLKALSEMSSAERLLRRTNGDSEGNVQSLRLLQAAAKSLEAASVPLEFQKKLLKLRIRQLQLIVDTSVLCEFVQRNYRLSEGADIKARQFYGKASILADRFQSLAEDFFMASISFVGIDRTSIRAIHGAVLQSSLLAFCIACTFSGSPNSTSSSRVGSFKVAEGYMREKGDFSDSEFIGILQRFALGRLRCKLNVPEKVANGITAARDELSKMKSEQFQGRIGILSKLCKDTKWTLPKHFFRTTPQTRLEWWTTQEGVSKHEAGSEQIVVSQGHALCLSQGFKFLNLPQVRLRKLSCLLRTRNLKFNDSAPLKDVCLLLWASRNKVTSSGTLVTMDVCGQKAFSSCTLQTAELAPGCYEVSCGAVAVDVLNSRWVIPCSTTFKFKVVG